MSRSLVNRGFLGRVSLGFAIIGLFALAAAASAATVVPINAGNGAYVAGTITVTNNGSTVTVTYETISGDTPGIDWKLDVTHLDIECDPGSLPTNRGGNPQIGRFEYQTDHDPQVDTFTYTVPAPEGCAVACQDSIVIAGHAVVYAYDPVSGNQIGKETGWAQGNPFVTCLTGVSEGGGGCGNWAMWFEAPLEGRLVKVASARWRSYANTSSSEVLVGRGSLSNAANRSEAQFDWTRPGTYDVTFTYDPNTLLLTATVEPGGGYVEFQLTEPLAQMDSFEIVLTDRDNGSQVDFGNIMLDGMPVGSFVGDGTQHIYGFPSVVLNDGFTFTGTLTISGNFSNSPERSKVDVVVGRCLVR